MGEDAMILVFWMLGFKSDFSLCYFSFIKGLFSSSFLSAIGVVSCAYLRLLIFLLAVFWFQLELHPAWYFTWCTLHISYISRWQYTASTNSFTNFEPVHCSMSSSNYYSWPTYRFLRRQVKWSRIPISLRIVHSLLWYTQTKTLV